MGKKIDCHIIQDLLPSYIDGLLSQESKEAVEEHLEGCNNCQKINEAMRTEIETVKRAEDLIEIDRTKKFLRKVALRKMVAGALISVVFIAAVSIGVWRWYDHEYLTSRIVVPADDIVILEVRDNLDGTVYVKFASDTDYMLIPGR